EAHLPAVDQEPSLVLLVDAGQDLDQGRFPGAVVAEDAGHLARVHARRDVAQRDHAPVVLREAVDLEQVGRRRCGHRAFWARVRTNVFSSTAANRIAPWNVYVQLLSHCASTIPSWTIPSMAAPKKVPITEP